jgi:hypothetical protein
VVPSIEVLLQAARERKRIEDALKASRDELNRIADEQAALRRLATLIAHGGPPGEVFGAVAREMAQILEARHAAVIRYEPDATATWVGIWNSGRVATLPLGSRPLEKGTAAELVARTGEPGRIEIFEATVGADEFHASLRSMGVNCAVGCPVTVGERLWGAVIAASTSDPLPEDTEERMLDFTDLLVTAIVNAESHAELEASRARVLAAADATRRLIEHDLHDGNSGWSASCSNCAPWRPRRRPTRKNSEHACATRLRPWTRPSGTCGKSPEAFIRRSCPGRASNPRSRHSRAALPSRSSSTCARTGAWRSVSK